MASLKNRLDWYFASKQFLAQSPSELLAFQVQPPRLFDVWLDVLAVLVLVVANDRMNYPPNRTRGFAGEFCGFADSDESGHRQLNGSVECSITERCRNGFRDTVPN